MRIYDTITRVLIATSSLFVLSCQGLESPDKQEHKIVATVGANNTKANFHMTETPDVLCEWNGRETLRVYYKQSNGRYHGIFADARVAKIEGDGKSADYTYTPEPEWRLDGKENSYQVAIFSVNCFPTIDPDDGSIYLDARLIRQPVKDFELPVYYVGEVVNGSVTATFSHYYSYEFLHVKNLSDKAIDFSLNGYETQWIWYKKLASVGLEDGMVYNKSWSGLTPAEVSYPVSIEPGSSDIIVSAYIPNDFIMKDAFIVATIDGNIVKSSNNKSSAAPLVPGRAYHMYATWDGTELKFENANESIDESVDLGLPSGLKWASCNLGASKPEESGNYYAWGETEPKSNYSWDTYKFGNINGLTKYSEEDNELAAEDDAATQALGDLWRMPTRAELEELMDNCDFEWTERESIHGLVFTSKSNGKHIFLPASGLRTGTSLTHSNQRGCYWTSTLRQSATANYLLIDDEPWLYANNRCNGYTIRPVYGPRGAAGKPILSVSPAQVNFGDVSVGSKKSMTVTIENTGNAILKYYVWSPSAPFSAEGYDFYSSSQETLGPGESKIVIVSYEPTELTEDSDWLRIESNAGGVEQRIALIGRGIEGINLGCPDNNHPHQIDLGLPSGTKWACCNLNAESPELYGGYFAWGETEEKERYEGSNYQHGDWAYSYDALGYTLFPYDLGYNISGSQYDAAYVNSHGLWVMPSYEQFVELVDNTTSEWATINGIEGRVFIGKNKKSIFFPITGFRYNSTTANPTWGYYWSSSMATVSSYSDRYKYSYVLRFNNEVVEYGKGYRAYGYVIRPVRPK